MSQWIKFKLKKYYFDPRTNKELLSVDGMKNRAKIDPFNSGNISPMPYIPKDKIVNCYGKDNVLLLELDITEGEARVIIERSEILDYLLGTYTFQDLEPTILNDTEAAVMKESFFGIINVESGVTNVGYD